MITATARALKAGSRRRKGRPHGRMATGRNRGIVPAECVQRSAVRSTVPGHNPLSGAPPNVLVVARREIGRGSRDSEVRRATIGQRPVPVGLVRLSSPVPSAPVRLGNLVPGDQVPLSAPVCLAGLVHHGSPVRPSDPVRQSDPERRIVPARLDGPDESNLASHGGREPGVSNDRGRVKPTQVANVGMLGREVS